MAALERWKLVEQLNVYQIALLMAEYDPAPFEGVPLYNWGDEAREYVMPYLVSLQNAVRTNTIETVFREYMENSEIDWVNTLVDTREICSWLKNRAFSDGFFVKSVTSKSDFTDAFGRHYAPKLVAAVDAWNAVTSDPKRLLGRSPKQALEKWLEENAKAYDLLNKDGTPNKTGIAEIAKVANWQPTGGVPKTPQPLPESPPRIAKNLPTNSPKPGGWFGGPVPDDEIPF